MISVASIRQRVTYSPETGELRWTAHAPLESFPDRRACNSWHAQKAGKLIKSTKDGYIRIAVTLDRKARYLYGHRVAWALMTGEWPKHEVDHDDRDRSNNKWSNLRAATDLNNSWNRGMSSNNTSGIIGVWWCKRHNRWKAEIVTDWRRKHLGSFKRVEDAIRARRAAEVAERGEFALGAAA